MPSVPELLPKDAANAELLGNVHPRYWKNPKPGGRYNLVVIGAGTAGLVTAAGAAGLGARVALIEKAFMGGDCLNVGCVPSKAMIRSSRVLSEVQEAGKLGVTIPAAAEVDFAAVMKRMREVRARISYNDSVQRFTNLGIDVYLGEGRFAGPDAVEVDGGVLHFRRAVIATGARAAAPPIEGLESAGYFTNETIFSLTEAPPRLAVIGGGAIGVELAQAFRRLGSEVVLLEMMPRLLEPEDTDAVEVLERSLLREGVRVITRCRVRGVQEREGGKVIGFDARSGSAEITVDEILVAAGRAPNVEGLNLDEVGVRYDAVKGVHVNDRLQTSNRRIYAAGDVAIDAKFTHAADFAARIVIQNALFMGRKKLSALTIPWCTYTDPEIARVGLSERAAYERRMPIDVYKRPFEELDRALIDGEKEGFVKILTKRGSDEIVGATIVARHAGEMIGELAMAMTYRIGLGKIAGVIHPYPTQAEAIRQLGDVYNRSRLTPFVARLFRRWLSWTR